jgi:GT2 family glycosyltransferase
VTTIVVPCVGARTSECFSLSAERGFTGPTLLQDAAESTAPSPQRLQAVSVVVINFNGGGLLADCVEGVLAQTHPAVEIIVVDNGSTDESAATIRRRFPEVRLFESPRNLGYAGAANVAVRETSSPYLLLLNPDVLLTPTFLDELVRAAEERPEAGSFTGKLLRRSHHAGPSIIDSAGHEMFRNRWAVNRGEDQEDLGQYDHVEEVFGVCGAAPLYRREMLEDVRVGEQVFAESFFLYLEDVDLDWRARLRGWKAFYVPTAVAYHERGFKAGSRSRDAAILRHAVKNRYLMMLRNDSVTDLLFDAWTVVPTELLRALDFALSSPRSFRGYLGIWPLLPQTLTERRTIRQGVRTSRQEMRRWIGGVPDWRQVAGRLRWLFTSRQAPEVQRVPDAPRGVPSPSIGS